MEGNSQIHGVSSLYINIPPINKEPIKAYVEVVDPVEAGEDYSSVSVIDRKMGSVEYTITYSIDDENNPVGRWFQGMVRRFKSQRKALFFALTHGYKVCIPCKTDNDDDGYIELTRPSQLRTILRCCKFIPQFKIFDGFVCPYEIYKGRLRPMRICTVPMLKEMMRKLVRYKI